MSAGCLPHPLGLGVGTSPAVGTADPAAALIVFVLIKSSPRRGRALCRCSCPPTNSLRGHAPLEFNISQAGETQQSRNRREKGFLGLEILFLVKKKKIEKGCVTLLGSIPLDSPAALANAALQQFILEV